MEGEAEAAAVAEEEGVAGWDINSIASSGLALPGDGEGRMSREDRLLEAKASGLTKVAL